MGRRPYGARAMSELEKKRKHDDEVCSIDKELEEAYANIDWNRRREAEKSLVNFVKTYMIGLTLEEPPPPLGEVVL